MEVLYLNSNRFGDRKMKIRLDDPSAPHVANLLEFHLRELRDVMGNMHSHLTRPACPRQASHSGRPGTTTRWSGSQH